MADVIIRATALADAGELLTLQRAAYATEAQIYRDPFLPALTQTLTELRRELTEGAGLVATAGPRIVASIRWRRDADVVHIGRITVAPDQQGNGLGTMLLRRAETASGARVAELFTGHLSEANLRLYRREGYEESRRETLHDGVELVYLTKRLA